MLHNVFEKKSLLGGTVKYEIMSNKQKAEKLHKPIIRKFEKRKVHSFFTNNIWGADVANNIWGADVADMQLIGKFNKTFRFLLCVIAIYSKYAWVILVKF